MQPHQLRVVDEKNELDDRIFILKAFSLTAIYQELDAAERVRLLRQLGAMALYSHILQERIDAF